MSVSAAKEQYAEKMNRLLDTYSKVLFCQIDNVRSMQLHNVRAALRGKGEMLVGKKTLQKKIIAIRAESESATDLDKLLKQKLVDENMLVGNLGLVFTNEDVADIQKIMNEFRVQAPARVGAIAPCDVTVPAGNTGLEPGMTSFFQALNIATKISKGTVEILSDKKVLAMGEKVDNSTAALLQKLNISPFFYAAEVQFFWERGLMFTAEDLQVTDEVIEKSMLEGISTLTSMSLGAGVLTEMSMPHAILDGFKNLLGAAVATEYVFEEFDGKQMIQDIKEGKVQAAAAPAAAAEEAAAAPAAAAEESEEDDDEMGFGGLF